MLKKFALDGGADLIYVMITISYWARVGALERSIASLGI